MTVEYKTVPDFGYWNPHPDIVPRQRIFDVAVADGWKLLSIEPAIDHPVAEHRKPPLLTFMREKP